MNLLVVEDDPVARLVMESILGKLGYTCTTASGGEEAWTMILNHPPDLVISDWIMPDLDGLELCRRVRSLKGFYVYFILITTENADRRNREEGMTAGVDEFLTKPIDEFELRVRLRGAQRISEYIERLRKLESSLPICSYCKKIRNDSDYWQQIESYIAERTGAMFSHAVCPECFRDKVQPDLEAHGIQMDYPTEKQTPKAVRVRQDDTLGL